MYQANFFHMITMNMINIQHNYILLSLFTIQELHNAAYQYTEYTKSA